jgi:hypothetical protein
MLDEKWTQRGDGTNSIEIRVLVIRHSKTQNAQTPFATRYVEMMPQLDDGGRGVMCDC